jgi:plasmid stabilization system protein ParE
LKRHRVELSPEALGHAQHIRAWWRENREAAPDLFVDELAQALQKLERFPQLGPAYSRAEIEGMRRILLPQSRYHAYYTVVEDPDTVRVHAIWHIARMDPLI